MKRMMRFSPILAVLLFHTAATAYAQDNSWYVGLGAGQTNADYTSPKIAYLDYQPFGVMTGPGGSFNITTTPGSLSRDETDQSTEFFFGYYLNPNLALEAGYSDLGTVSTNTRVDDVVTSPVQPDAFTRERNIRSTHESEALSLTLLGSLPLTERLSLLGMLGAIYTDTSASERTVTTSSNGSFSDSSSRFEENNSSVLAGIGLSLAMSSNFEIRVLYKYFPNAGEQNYGRTDNNGEQVVNGDFDIQQGSIQLLYKF